MASLVPVSRVNAPGLGVGDYLLDREVSGERRGSKGSKAGTVREVEKVRSTAFPTEELQGAAEKRKKAVEKYKKIDFKNLKAVNEYRIEVQKQYQGLKQNPSWRDTVAGDLVTGLDSIFGYIGEKLGISREDHITMTQGGGPGVGMFFGIDGLWNKENPSAFGLATDIDITGPGVGGFVSADFMAKGMDNLAKHLEKSEKESKVFPILKDIEDPQKLKVNQAKSFADLLGAAPGNIYFGVEAAGIIPIPFFAPTAQLGDMATYGNYYENEWKPKTPWYLFGAKKASPAYTLKAFENGIVAKANQFPYLRKLLMNDKNVKLRFIPNKGPRQHTVGGEIYSEGYNRSTGEITNKIEQFGHAEVRFPGYDGNDTDNFIIEIYNTASKTPGNLVIGEYLHKLGDKDFGEPRWLKLKKELGDTFNEDGTAEQKESYNKMTSWFDRSEIDWKGTIVGKRDSNFNHAKSGWLDAIIRGRFFPDSDNNWADMPYTSSQEKILSKFKNLLYSG